MMKRCKRCKSKNLKWKALGDGEEYTCLKCGRLIQELDEFVLVRVFEEEEDKMKLVQEETVQ